MMDYPPPPSTLWSGLPPSPEKSSQILIHEYPHRAIAIVSSNHALLLRHSPPANEVVPNGPSTSVTSLRARTGGDGLISKCMVEFSPLSEQLLSDYRSLTPRPIYGTLGLISIGRDVFLCVITQASRVATLRPGETVEKIEGVQFFCLNSSEYDDVVSLDSHDPDSDAASVYGQNLGRREVQVEHPCQELQKLLSNGTFYYSTDFDVTNRMQDRSADAVAFDIDNFDESFLWNSYMISPLVEFRSRLQRQARDALDASRILTSAIRGFCKSYPIPQSMAPLSSARTGLPSYLTVISRLSCRRAGTRFNSRGIDDDGNVANFVETETIYWSPSGVVFSYAQVRGSVPIFWEQTAGLIPNQQKITITRSADGTQPAFDKHFAELEKAYGAVHVINLLSASKPGEAELTSHYRYAIDHCPLKHPGEKNSADHALLRETRYDFHLETKEGYDAAKGIRREIEDSADGFAYYLAQESEDIADEAEGPTKNRRYVVVLQQEGVFRTNCLDCLDRTNLIQTIISQMAVESFLMHRGKYAASDFWSRHADLWADNGDSLSKTYAGTGALKSSFTRHGKMSLAGAIADVRKSATRLYYNNFADKARQTTIDTLLGRLVGQIPVILYDPISEYVAVELHKRNNEFSSTEKINMWVGTFNVNGRTEGIDEDLSPWICPPTLGTTQPEIVAVGLQEIVELSPQQIMNSDPSRKQLWEKAIKRTLDSHAHKVGGDKYVLLRSGQLVGAALCIFVKASVLHYIKNVEGAVKKTGLSGIAGNKGAVAIRLDYANTPICFVTAHLAAGFHNYEERNRDFATIYNGLRFQRNRGIDDHDSVVWFGDFNYRIGLGLETAKELVRQGNLEELYENDQLYLQMRAGLAFSFYSEARITFLPTYKFDIGTDEYDSSEKQRIPAWTDRILRKGANVRQLSYNSAPLRFSDHRPVYATFECTVSIVNEPLRDRISREIYEHRKAEVGNGISNAESEDTEDEDLVGYDAIEPGLPPASSDRQKWWLENGKMARSSISPPKPPNSSYQTILNPKRPSNPYVPTDEPDWVNIPRSESRLSSFSSISTSPYEQVNHSMLLSTSASSSVPRKLPSPYDPSTLPARVGRVTVSDEPRIAQLEGPPPPPPPPRRQPAGPGANGSSIPVPSAIQPIPNLATKPGPAPPTRSASAASQKSLVSSKPAPLVAKKPAHLASASSTPGASSPDTTTAGAEEHFPAQKRTLTSRPLSTVQSFVSAYEGATEQRPIQVLPRNGSFGPSPASTAGAPTLPYRTNSISSIPPSRLNHVGAVGLVGLADGDGRPQLPTRKAVSAIASSIGSVPVSPAPADAPAAAAADGIPTAAAQKPRPPPPLARKPVMQSVDLLGDDAGVNMGHGWEALKPSS